MAGTLTRRGFVGAVGATSLLGGRRARAEETVKGRLYFAGHVENNGQDAAGLFGIDLETGQWDHLAEGSTWARVSRDGKSMVFPKLKKGTLEPDGVWLVEARGGGEPRRISELGGLPFWSPDGRELIVSGFDGDGGKDGEFRFVTWRMKSDGSARVKLPIPADEHVEDWSADGHRFLTSKLEPPKAPGAERAHAIFVRNADGTDPTRLSEGTQYVTHRFSPDGRRVCYSKDESEKDAPSKRFYSLWIVDARGGEPHRVIRGKPELSAFFSCWSPDGRWLAVDLIEHTRNADGEEVGRTRHIEIMDDKGSSRLRVDLPHIEPIPLDWTKAP